MRRETNEILVILSGTRQVNFPVLFKTRTSAWDPGLSENEELDKFNEKPISNGKN